MSQKGDIVKPRQEQKKISAGIKETTENEAKNKNEKVLKDNLEKM